MKLTISVSVTLGIFDYGNHNVASNSEIQLVQQFFTTIIIINSRRDFLGRLQSYLRIPLWEEELLPGVDMHIRKFALKIIMFMLVIFMIVQHLAVNPLKEETEHVPTIEFNKIAFTDVWSDMKHRYHQYPPYMHSS